MFDWNFGIYNSWAVGERSREYSTVAVFSVASIIHRPFILKSRTRASHSTSRNQTMIFFPRRPSPVHICLVEIYALCECEYVNSQNGSDKVIEKKMHELISIPILLCRAFRCDCTWLLHYDEWKKTIKNKKRRHRERKQTSSTHHNRQRFVWHARATSTQKLETSVNDTNDESYSESA